MRFNVSGGLAFIITAVGNVCLGNTKAGLLLFICITAAALLCAAGNALFIKKQPLHNGSGNSGVPFSQAFTDAASQTVHGLLMMCAFIVLFSALLQVLRPPEALMPLLEITNGVCLREEPLPLPFYAFFLSFGGLCVHLQLFPFLREMDISYMDFLCGRMLCALLSYGLCRLYLVLFPQQTAVFSALSAHAFRPVQESPALSAVMILGCAVVIFDIENRKSKLI